MPPPKPDPRGITYWISLKSIEDVLKRMKLIVWGPTAIIFYELVEAYWNPNFKSFALQCAPDKANDRNISEFIPLLFELYTIIQEQQTDPKYLADQKYKAQFRKNFRQNPSLKPLMQRIRSIYGQYLDFRRARQTFKERRKQEEGQSRGLGLRLKKNPYLVNL